MTSLGTAILLTLSAVLAVAGGGCDSNPTPHPGQNKGDRGSDALVGSVGGEVTGTELPDYRNPDDDFPGAMDPDNDEGTGSESCRDARDAADGHSDGDALDGADGGDDDATVPDAQDRGPSEVTPDPTGGADYGEVEGSGGADAQPTVRRRSRTT